MNSIFKPTMFFDEGAKVLGVVMTQEEISIFTRFYIPSDVSEEAEWARKVTRQLADARMFYIEKFGECELRCYPRIYDGALV